MVGAESVDMRRMRLRRALRVATWNLALLAGGAVALLVAGEAWSRATQPFILRDGSYEWVPGVGMHPATHSEVRWTNWRDFWVASRANRFGFLDREPPSPARARASCHVAIVGDSFVDAREVSLGDKAQVRLEEMAARRLPTADVTTTGWGRRGSGQIHQLSFWDMWIHRYSPKLVVLVFVDNDISDNRHGPPRLFTSASLSPSGQIALRRPSMLHAASTTGRPLRDVYQRGHVFYTRTSFLYPRLPRPPPPSRRGRWLQFTAFALDQWLERTQRAGASLVVLASHTMRTTAWTLDGGESLFEWLAREARKRGIPVVDQSDYIARNGGLAGDAHWEHDHHWSPQGHQWAAQAMLEWLEQNLWTCGG